MKPIDFHPAAAEEAREAAMYYENVREGLGDDFGVTQSTGSPTRSYIPNLKSGFG